MPEPSPEPHTVDRLRNDIDRGLTGEKVPGADPAAAPLGTDDEAGGAPPTRAERELEQLSRPSISPQTSKGPRRARWIGAGCILVLVALVVALLVSV